MVNLALIWAHTISICLLQKGMDFGTEVVSINSQGSFLTTNGKYQLHVLAESSNTPL